MSYFFWYWSIFFFFSDLFFKGRHIDSDIFSIMGGWIVYMITPDSPVLSYLSRFLTTLRSYFYPSNEGKWTSKLAMLLEALCTTFIQRMKKEREGNLPHPELHLNDQVINEFVNILLPIIRTAMFAKNTFMKAAVALSVKQLAYAAPSLLPPALAPYITYALETLTETHQAPAALQILSAHLHPSIAQDGFAPSLVASLFASLPGIDPNDEDKSLYTLRYLYAFLSHVPLVDASDVNVEGEDKKLWKERRMASSHFSDWAVSFLERLCLYLYHQDKGPDVESFKQRLFLAIFDQTATLFFFQAGKELHGILARKLMSYVRENTLLNAKREFGRMVDFCVWADTSTFPSFLSLIQDIEVEDGKVRGAENFLIWRIHILSKACHHAGTALLKHEDELLEWVRLTIWHDKKGVAKAGCKLFKNLLYSLTHTYPADHRSLPPETWKDEEVLKQTHWKVWGNDIEGNYEWHEPTVEESKMANRITVSILDTCIQKLKFVEEGGLKRDQIRTHLRAIIACVQGASLIAPREREEWKKRHEWDVCDMYHYVGEERADERVKHLRSEVGNLAHDLLQTQAIKSDIKSRKFLLKVNFTLLLASCSSFLAHGNDYYEQRH